MTETHGTNVPRRTLLTLVVSVSAFLALPNHVKAGPLLPGSGWGDTPAAFAAIIDHGPIAAGAIHVFGAGLFWDFEIKIIEVDGAGAVADFIGVEIDGEHIVGVPGHIGEGPNPPGVLFGLATPAGPFMPGFNVINVGPLDDPHPPRAGHLDSYNAVLTFVVLGNGLDFDAYALGIGARHCGSPCPLGPVVDQPFRNVREPGIIAMLIVAGLSFTARRANRRKCVRE